MPAKPEEGSPSEHALVAWKRRKREVRMRAQAHLEPERGTTVSDRISDVMSFSLLGVLGLLILMAVGADAVLLLTRETPVVAAIRPGVGQAGKEVAPQDPSRMDGTSLLSGAAASSEITPSAPSERDTKDFFTELSREFQDGDSHIDLEVESPEEKILFEAWRRAANPKGQTQGLSLIRREREPEGGGTYELSVEATNAHGLLHVKLVNCRWSIVSIEPPGQPVSKAAEKTQAMNPPNPNEMPASTIMVSPENQE